MNPTIPEGYRPDAQGRLVPIVHIKQVDLLRDDMVAELVKKAKELNALLAAFRVEANNTIEAFAQLSAEKYQAKLGGKKGNLTLVSFDGRLRIIRAISDQLVFDERLQAAKVLIDDCLKEWTQGSRTELQTLIDGAFKVDHAGKIDTARVLSLRSYDIKDERWKRAMEAIGDSLKVASSRSYLRFYERVGETAHEVAINLDLANA
ncbi:MAG: DUF3164 family protein [Burkholderiales bacterium]|nr:DUF3164 family protein [Opitutaceae bacterium]